MRMIPGRVALGLGPLVTEEGYTSSGSSDSRDTAERSMEAAVAQDALDSKDASKRVSKQASTQVSA